MILNVYPCFCLFFLKSCDILRHPEDLLGISSSFLRYTDLLSRYSGLSWNIWSISWDVLILPEISWSILRCQENFLRYPQDILRFPAIILIESQISWPLLSRERSWSILRHPEDLLWYPYLRLIWHCPVILGDLSWYLLRFSWSSDTRPGKQSQKANWKMDHWNIVDLSINHGDIPVRYVTVYQRVSPVNFLRYPEDILIHPDDTVIYY